MFHKSGTKMKPLSIKLTEIKFVLSPTRFQYCNQLSYSDTSGF